MFTKDENRLHQFSSEVLKGILVGYASNAESGWIGDLLVADAEELKNNTTSEVHINRFEEKEQGVQHVVEQFMFPCTHGSKTKSGRK